MVFVEQVQAQKVIFIVKLASIIIQELIKFPPMARNSTIEFLYGFANITLGTVFTFGVIYQIIRTAFPLDCFILLFLTSCHIVYSSAHYM